VLFLWCTLLHVFSYNCHYEWPNHCGGTTSCSACVVWVVWGYVVGGTLVSGTTQQCQKYCTIHNTDTVAYATHSGSYTRLNAKRSTPATHLYTLVHMWYTTITVVHNIHNGAQHIHDTETFRLLERQIASTVISVLICQAGTLTLSYASYKFTSKQLETWTTKWVLVRHNN